MESIATKDLQTFPRESPAVQVARQKQEAAEEKVRKAEEAARKKQTQQGAKKYQELKEIPTVADDVKMAKARETKLLKIRLYFQKLGHRLEPTIREPKVYPRSDEEINQLLASIELHLQSSGGINFASKAFVQGCALIEQGTRVFNPLGWQLHGPATSLTQAAIECDGDWHDLVTEWAISNADWFIVGPGYRLLGFSLTLIQTVDAKNKMALMGMRHVPKEKEEAMKDL